LILQERPGIQQRSNPLIVVALHASVSFGIAAAVKVEDEEFAQPDFLAHCGYTLDGVANLLDLQRLGRSTE
jgi:hypothetical protein